MLTWMQHHKKYLIITIWISVIAFVGAGFVGWGSYSMNKNKSSAVAKVGNSYITIEEFDEKYKSIFNYYNSIFQGNFTQEQAQAAKLQDLAINQLIQEQMFLNFAEELGIKATKDEILNVIIYDRTFYEDGKFNKNKYINILRENGIYPHQYESNIKKEITLAKLFENFQTRVDKIEFEALNANNFIEDELAIKIINADENISINEDELKEFWEINKNNYQTLKSYDLQLATILPENEEFSLEELNDFYSKNRDIFIDEDDKILSFEQAQDKIKKELALQNAKEKALKDYILAKKGELVFDKNLSYDATTSLPKNVKAQDIEQLSLNEVLKPVKTDDEFIILKLSKINMPMQMTFEQAKDLALIDYKEFKIKELLEKKAEEEMHNFEGTNIGFINLNNKAQIENLSQNETDELINVIKNTKLNRNFIIFNNKAVIYDIITKRVNFIDLNNDSNFGSLEEKAKNIKNTNIRLGILKELSKKYKVVRYF